MMRQFFFPILLLILFTSGCSTGSYQPASSQPLASAQIGSIANSDSVREKLYEQYQQWKGTQYRYGGLSKSGVDCSGLVYLTYQDKLGIAIPRTTQSQAKVGQAVQRNQLQAGDLVFFLTEVKGRHVGIYLEDGKFLHASTSKGVMISRLSDYYWKDRYWQARRVAF